MNILFPVAYLYPSENGGPALSLYWLTKELVKINHNVTIVTTSKFTNNKIKPNRWLNTDYGRVIYLKVYNPLISIRYIYFTIREILKNDVVIITSLFAFPNFIFILYCVIMNKEIIISPRGEADPQALIYNRNFKIFILFFYNLLPTKRVLFHVTSFQERNYLLSVLKKKYRIEIIPNFLELPVLRDFGDIPKDYFLFVGRFHRKKAIENLIEALSKSNLFLESNFCLKLVGDYRNSYGEYIRDLVLRLSLENKIEFVGELFGEDKEAIYANAFCTIVPSHTENFCNVVIESLSQNTPVIASKGTPWAILNEMKIGYWVDNSSDSLAKTIDSFLLLNVDDYNLMRISSRKFIELNYDICKGVYIWNRVLSEFKYQSV